MNRDEKELYLKGQFNFPDTNDVDEEYYAYEVDPYEVDIDYGEIYSEAKRDIDVMQKNIEEKEAELEKHQHSVIEKQAVKGFPIPDLRSTAIFGGILVAIVVASLSAVKVAKPLKAYAQACSDMKNGKYDAAIASFEALGDYKNSENLLLETKHSKANDLFEDGNYNQAILVYTELDGYRDSNRRIGELIGIKKDSIAVGVNHTVAIKSIGRVVATGDNSFGQCNVDGWNNIQAVCAGANHTVGLDKDGNVFATGDNSHNQCNVSSWTGIVAVQTGDTFTVGLKADGTLLVTGYVGDEATINAYKSLSNVVKISSCVNTTVCLLNDGTVYSISNGTKAEIPALKSAVDIACGKTFVAGISAENKLVTTGKKLEIPQEQLKNNIQYIQAGEDKLYVVNEKRKVYTTNEELLDFSGALMLAVGKNHSVAYMSDGSVKAMGDNSFGQCNVQDWGDILLK